MINYLPSHLRVGETKGGDDMSEQPGTEDRCSGKERIEALEEEMGELRTANSILLRIADYLMQSTSQAMSPAGEGHSAGSDPTAAEVGPEEGMS